MHKLIKRLVLWLALATFAAQPIMAQAQGIDPAARGLAAQAKTYAARRGIIARLQRAALVAAYNNPIDAAVSAIQPTITAGSSHSTSLTQMWYATDGAGNVNPMPIRSLGGAPYVLYGPSGLYSSYTHLVSLSHSPGTGNISGANPKLNAASPADTTLSATTATYEFITDAPIVEIAFDGYHEYDIPAGWHLYINGAAYSKTATLFTTGSATLSINFGSRAHRIVKFVAQRALLSLAIGPTDYIMPTQKGITALVVGDSYERGGNLASGFGDLERVSVPGVLKNLMGWSTTINAGIGGTGYYNNGSNSGAAQNTYRQRLTAGPGLVTLSGGDPDVVILKSSQNDWTQGFDSNSVLAEALACWQAYRAAFPKSLIIITGLHSQNTGPNANFISGENALLAKFNAWADPFSIFVPISTDTLPWMKGTGFSGTPSGSGSNDNYLYTDASHLNGIAGNEYDARRMAVGIRAKLDRLEAAYSVQY